MLRFRQINLPRKEKFLLAIPREELKTALAVGVNLQHKESLTIIHPDNYGYASSLLDDHKHVAVLMVDTLSVEHFRTKVRSLNPTQWRTELRSDGIVQYAGAIKATQIRLHSVIQRGDAVDKQWTGAR